LSESERLLADYARRDVEVPPERYSPANPAHLFIRHTVERALVEMLPPLAGRRVVEVGCGAGQLLVDLETLGAARDRLAGIDLVPDRVAAAAARLPGADIREGDAASLPWESGSFDVVLQSMMLSSVLDASVRTAAEREMARVVAPRGVVVSYDFFVRSPGNPGVRPLSRSELADLFPGFLMRWRRITLAPPLVRLLVPRLRPLAAGLQALRVFDTHAMAVLTRR
jgi:ubiquinone/menaquinone biosynthesis C-methylase UbiE